MLLGNLAHLNRLVIPYVAISDTVEFPILRADGTLDEKRHVANAKIVVRTAKVSAASEEKGFARTFGRNQKLEVDYRPLPDVVRELLPAGAKELKTVIDTNEHVALVCYTVP